MTFYTFCVLYSLPCHYIALAKKNYPCDIHMAAAVRKTWITPVSTTRGPSRHTLILSQVNQCKPLDHNTVSYTFTDYHLQVQTIDYCIVNLATPLSGQLTSFNAYIALSRSHGRNGIRLLHDFNERLFTHHPSEHLHREDTHLNQPDDQTKGVSSSFIAE